MRILIILIIVLAIILRFANYENRWTLQQDQSRDAIIALYSIKQGTLPLLGPPSSAGQFSFGPLYYWTIILFTLLLPNLVNGPWIGFTILSVISVFIFYRFGKAVADQSFGIILALIAAFAPLDVFNAPDMLNPMLIGLSTVLLFFSLILLIDKKKIAYSILAGFFVGASINFHLQSLGLLLILPGAIVVNKYNFKQKLILFFGMLAGLILSFAPLIYFDVTHKGDWIRSVYEFLSVGQNKFYLQESFFESIKSFWPHLWGEVITGFPATGYLLIALFCIAAVLAYKKKMGLSKASLVIVFSFFAQIILIYFYKGPRLPVYLIVYHPFIIFLTGWSLWVIWRFKQRLGIILILAVVGMSSYSDWGIINSSSQAPLVLSIKQKIDQIKTDDKSVYSYQSSNTISLPLFYLWLKEGKISDQGHKIGACKFEYVRNPVTYDTTATCPVESKILVYEKEYMTIDLDFSSSEELNKLDKLKSEEIYNWLYSNYPKH